MAVAQRVGHTSRQIEVGAGRDIRAVVSLTASLQRCGRAPDYPNESTGGYKTIRITEENNLNATTMV
jgi:hypothetical protein